MISLKTILSTFGLIVTQTFTGPGYNNTWLCLNDKHWIIDSGAPIPQPVVTSCGPNMMKVVGEMKQDPSGSYFDSVDQLQKKACISWIERKEPLDKCGTYDRNKWLELSKNLKTKHMDFCIDKFEAPNVEGQNPIIMVSLLEAENLCSNVGKRVCTEDEITFACEGEEAIPYGYGTGYKRDDTFCAIDKKWKPYTSSSFRIRNSEKLAHELDNLWQGEPSGARTQCVTPFGIHDFPGNVDEITRSTRPGTHKLALKGGYFAGHVRNRCRATTRSHTEYHTFYQEGFRCCK